MKKREHPPSILIVDVATSGFKPESSEILEITCILADAGTLDILDTASVVIKHIPGIVELAPDFHAQLAHECATSENACKLKPTEGFLLAGPWTTCDIVANNALMDFDMKFLAKHLPLFHAALSKFKLHLDIRALEMMHVAAGGTPYVPGPRTYRSIDDAIAAYEALCHYRGIQK